ncbi:hypothetical protein B0H13DRAFT_1893654 [Mycena leptocephala]|nr:hypothetical protein B0H13DRAFT_1893654 [Mycena leptocephala]
MDRRIQTLTRTETFVGRDHSTWWSASGEMWPTPCTSQKVKFPLANSRKRLPHEFEDIGTASESARGPKTRWDEETSELYIAPAGSINGEASGAQTAGRYGGDLGGNRKQNIAIATEKQAIQQRATHSALSMLAINRGCRSRASRWIPNVSLAWWPTAIEGSDDGRKEARRSPPAPAGPDATRLFALLSFVLSCHLNVIITLYHLLSPARCLQSLAFLHRHSSSYQASPSDLWQSKQTIALHLERLRHFVTLRRTEHPHTSHVLPFRAPPTLSTCILRIWSYSKLHASPASLAGDGAQHEREYESSSIRLLCPNVSKKHSPQFTGAFTEDST